MASMRVHRPRARATVRSQPCGVEALWLHAANQARERCTHGELLRVHGVQVGVTPRCVTTQPGVQRRRLAAGRPSKHLLHAATHTQH
jgi:hypothetical protein